MTVLSDLLDALAARRHDLRIWFELTTGIDAWLVARIAVAAGVFVLVVAVAVAFRSGHLARLYISGKTAFGAGYVRGREVSARLVKWIPPVHVVYLVVLAGVLIPAYFEVDYERSRLALIILVVAPLALIMACSAIRLFASPEVRVTTAIIIWTVLPTIAAFDFYLEATTLSQETKIDRIMRERVNDPSTLTAVVPQGFLTITDPPGTFSLPDDSGGRFLPLADVSNTRSVYCKETGDYLVYRSDEKGFHNPAGIWSQKVGIAFVGDSYIHGACVPSGSDLTSLVRKKIPQTINLGRGGNGPLSELAILTEYAAVARPRLVVWFHVDNDLRDLRTEKLSSILMSYLSSDGMRNLAGRTAEIDRIVRAYLETQLAEQAAVQQKTRTVVLRSELSWKGIFDSLTFRTVRQQLLYPRFGTHDQILGSGDEDLQDLDWDLYARVLKEAKLRVEGWGGRFVVMIIPFQSGAGFLDPHSYPPARAYRDRLARIYDDLGIRYHDLNEDFHLDRDPNSYLADLHRYYGHENVAGYARLADATLRFIERVCGPDLRLCPR